jgi:putative hemolysin
LADGGSIYWPLLLQLTLILINAVFACAEIAVISISDTKLAMLSTTGDQHAVKLSELTEQPARFLATIQVGITLAGFLASAFAADNFAGLLVNWLISLGVAIPTPTLNTISVITITLILSYFTLVFGELVPKRIAMKYAEKMALGMSGLIYFVSQIFSPLVWLLTASTNGILQLMGVDPHDEEDEITEEEIRMMLHEGSKRGAIDLSENEMIQNIFEFDDKTAEEVMTHRTEVAVLWLAESIEQWEETIAVRTHSYYPICDETTDKVIGVLKTKYFFRTKEKTRDNIMKNAVGSAYFVPETVRTDVLFRNMQKSRNHFAVVLDEYGGMSGIITMNDLLEELVGDLEDDASIPVEPPLIEPIDSHTWKIHGATPLRIVSKQLGVQLPKDYDTFAGFVFGLLGFIPEDGSKPELDAYGLTIKVTEIKEHQLERAVVCLDQ